MHRCAGQKSVLTHSLAGEDRQGGVEAEPTEERIEALGLQVSRLMTVMQAMQDADSGAMRKLEAR